MRSVRESGEGGRWRSRGRSSSAAPATAPPCWRAIPISAAACWSGSDERCYDRESGRFQGASVSRDSVIFGVAGVFFGILVGWIVGSQQGATAAPASSGCGRTARRRRASVGNAARRGARGGARADRRAQSARRQRAPGARQPLFRRRALRGRRALVRAGARDRAAQREREHRPRHQLLLHEPAGPGAAAVRSLAGHRSAPHQDAAQSRHRAGVRQGRSRRRRAGLAARRRVRAGLGRRQARQAGTRQPAQRASQRAGRTRRRPANLQGLRGAAEHGTSHGDTSPAPVPVDPGCRPRGVASGEGCARGRGLSARRRSAQRGEGRRQAASAIRSAAPTSRRPRPRCCG